MLKRRRSESESDSSDSFDEDADEYGDESMNQKISNVSGIVAPEVYQQKKKRRRLADKGTSTANAVGPKKVAFADEVQQKSAEATTASTTAPSNVGTRITLPRISDMVNTSIKAKQNGAISSPKPLINSKEDLEHDRSLDEKRVEKLLTAFDTDEEIAERALEKAKQEEISKLAAQKTVSQETSKTLEASAKPSFSFGTTEAVSTGSETKSETAPSVSFSFGALGESSAPKPTISSGETSVTKVVEASNPTSVAVTTASNAITTTTSATAQPQPSLNFAFGAAKEAPKTSGSSVVPETEKPNETTSSGFKIPEEPAKPSVAKTLDFSFGATSTASESIKPTTSTPATTAPSLPSTFSFGASAPTPTTESSSSSTFTFGAASKPAAAAAATEGSKIAPASSGFAFGAP